MQIDFASPMDMRAPGAAVGVYALECAMDELSYALGIDPLELRLRNYAEIDGNEDKPFTSKALKDCYYQGAERFGWSKRQPSLDRCATDASSIGYGMATGIWEALRVPTSAEVELSTRREAHRQHRRCRYWHRYLHHSGSDRRRDAWLAARPSRDQDRRFEPAAMPCRRRLMDGGVGRLGGYAGLRGRSRSKSSNVAQRIKNSPLKGAEPADIEFVEGEIRTRSDPPRRVPLKDVLREINEAIKSKVTSIARSGSRKAVCAQYPFGGVCRSQARRGARHAAGSPAS